MCSGFRRKDALFDSKGDTHRIELDDLDQHTACRIDQTAGVELAVPHPSTDRRGDPGKAERDVAGFKARFGLFERSACHVTLHQGVIDVVSADGIAGAEALKARELLLRLA
ncbi:hypothetical protein D3C80_1317400 [compost metagenome]